MEDFFAIILPLFCLTATSSASFQVLGAAYPVIAVAGEEVLLPCYLSPNGSAENLTITWLLNQTGALVHLYKDGSDWNDHQTTAYRGRTTLFKDQLRNGNASLKLTKVQVSDEADYTCSIQSGNWSGKISLQVKVNVSIQAVGPVIVVAGEDVLLPCYLSPNVSAENLTITWLLNQTGALVHRYKDGCDCSGQQPAVYRGRTTLFKDQLRKGNASLKLTKVQVSDEADYTCSIQDGHWHKQISVQVIVQVRPDLLGPARPVIATAGEDVLLPCYLSPNVSAENLTITWLLNQTGKLVHLYKDGSSGQQPAAYTGRTALFKDQLRKGNASLKLTKVQVSDEADYTCSIQDGHWHKQISVQVIVKDGSTGQTHSWKAAFSIVFLMAAALAVALALLLRHLRFTMKEPHELRLQTGTYASRMHAESDGLSLQTELVKTRMPLEVEKMRRYGVDVILDPSTAHPQLILSADGKQVISGDAPQRAMAPSEERFSSELCVLAKEGFTQGCHYYEVLVQGNHDWTIGLLWEHIDRRGSLNANAYDLYLALKMQGRTCYSSESSDPIFELGEDIQRIGVCVDYEEGNVSFYEVKDKYLVHLYSFTQYYFTGSLYPVFSPGARDGENSTPLVILPVWDVRTSSEEVKPLLTYSVKLDETI